MNEPVPYGAWCTIERLSNQNTRLVAEMAVLQRAHGEALAYGARRTTQLNDMVRENDSLRALLLKSKRQHHYCEDSWYSCPKAEDGCADPREIECNCGADKWNAEVDAALGDTK